MRSGDSFVLVLDLDSIDSDLDGDLIVSGGLSTGFSISGCEYWIIGSIPPWMIELARKEYSLIHASSVFIENPCARSLAKRSLNVFRSTSPMIWKYSGSIPRIRECNFPRLPKDSFILDRSSSVDMATLITPAKAEAWWRMEGISFSICGSLAIKFSYNWMQKSDDAKDDVGIMDPMLIVRDGLETWPRMDFWGEDVGVPWEMVATGDADDDEMTLDHDDRSRSISSDDNVSAIFMRGWLTTTLSFSQSASWTDVLLDTEVTMDVDVDDLERDRSEFLLGIVDMSAEPKLVGDKQDAL
ncbi:hypothetical protein OGAPHI_000373 [Ogataea philodendri]|uniref:Uncharacterized protein n=1 Tax=Ogataea philodendri TaxID=1378263 RepID=A0A9P8PG57_9ASCO|nr:uncharacterized protein OGAPHI_000373 [Ogataea philodendri]KAH3671668.1 hypothetical protein OGAPHI_000373 [Ogataea philodendri]